MYTPEQGKAITGSDSKRERTLSQYSEDISLALGQV